MIPAREEVPIKCSSIAAYVCRVTVSGMDVLLIRRSAGYLESTWQMVSGKIEKGETAWQAALREIKEEVGVVPDRFYSADRMETFYEVSQNCINLIPIFVGFVDNNQSITISNEHTEHRWVSYDKVGDFMKFRHQMETCRWIFKQFVQKVPFEFLEIKMPKSSG
jgi:dATP pyrophosphohydrolase